MSKEQGDNAIRLTGIHVNLEEHRIEFEDSHGTVASVEFPTFGTIYFRGEAPSVPESSAPAENEREAAPQVTLTGRLTTKPRQGRLDRSGNPTAYARFMAHDPDRQGPHDYIATFHRHTARIALGLPRDAQITVEGYPHPSQDERRMDSLSVINFVHYPGKSDKRRSLRGRDDQLAENIKGPGV